MHVDVNNIDFDGNNNQNQDANNQGGNGGEGGTGGGTGDNNNNDNGHEGDGNHEGDGDGNNNNQNQNNNQEPEKPYEEGTVIETPDGTFTVDANGNFVDDKGAIFKEAKDVKDYISQFNDEGALTKGADLQAIQTLIGLEVTDENGKPMEFTDDDAGKKAYIDEVLKFKQKEATDIALNTYFTNNPMIKQFADYVQLGGDPANFGKIPDRTNIQFDPNDAEQHKRIIATAWAEEGRLGDVEAYIKFHETSGSLADVAKKELEGLKQKDAAFKQQIAEDAKKQREADEQEHAAYINSIYEKVNAGVIGGYKIPETVVVESNGQKLNRTRADFFNYVTRIDANGQTGYQKDLNAMSDSDYLDRELLDAWMHFSGGSYKTLVDMAIKANEANRIKLIAKKANSNSAKTVKITPKPANKQVSDDLLF